LIFLSSFFLLFFFFFSFSLSFSFLLELFFFVFFFFFLFFCIFIFFLIFAAARRPLAALLKFGYSSTHFIILGSLRFLRFLGLCLLLVYFGACNLSLGPPGPSPPHLCYIGIPFSFCFFWYPGSLRTSYAGRVDYSSLRCIFIWRGSFFSSQDGFCFFSFFFFDVAVGSIRSVFFMLVSRISPVGSCSVSHP